MAGPPLSFPPLRILFQLGLGGGGILLPEGVGLSWRAKLGRPASPPLVLYILRQRHPRETEVDPRDLFLSRVRRPQPP